MSGKSGQCLCGAVRFTAHEVDTDIGACHCRMCQRWAGGPFIAVTSKGVKFEDETELHRYQSSNWAERGNCRKCGSIVFYRLLASDDFELAVGAFDDSSDFRMSGEIFVDLKPACYEFAGEHPRLNEKETMARFKEFGE